MEDLQIYDQIGKGSKSVIYKARQRRTIQYVAVKSIDKADDVRVKNEVSLL